MKKILSYILLFIVFNFFCLYIITAKDRLDFNYNDLGSMPILNDGRLKTIDTFARINLLYIYGKDKIDNISAIEWFTELLFDKKKAYNRFVFYLDDNNLCLVLGLSYKKKHLYSFYEVSNAIKNNIDYIQQLYIIKSNNLSFTQQKVVDLYIKSLWFINICNINDIFLSKITIYDENLSKFLCFNPGESFSYIDLIDKKEYLNSLVSTLFDSNNELYNAELKMLLDMLNNLSLKSFNNSLCIVPSKYKNELLMFTIHNINIDNITYFFLWKNLKKAYDCSNAFMWNRLCSDIKSLSFKFFERDVIFKVKLEFLYNKLLPFDISKYVYLFVFFMGVLRKVFIKNNNLLIFNYYILFSGLFFHLLGIIMRFYIMNRPPVTTLYESIIFVGLIIVLLTFLLKKIKFSGIDEFVGGFFGFMFIYIASKYIVDGDTMGVLPSVLNTNFWLTAHVITITIGYSCCFIVGIMSHIYLLRKIFKSSDYYLLKLFKNILFMALISLFFSLLGTVLGGIWADQSWGRFWGWDPKENGALLIVLWLILLLHARIANIITEVIFIIGMSYINVVVIMAWFGVNILNIGFHSYGFTRNISLGINIFSLLEVVFISIISYLIYIKEKRYI